MLLYHRLVGFKSEFDRPYTAEVCCSILTWRVREANVRLKTAHIDNSLSTFYNQQPID